MLKYQLPNNNKNKKKKKKNNNKKKDINGTKNPTPQVI